MYRALLLLILFASLNVYGQDLPFERLVLNADRQGSRGVSVADLDGNGFLDIVVANQVDSTRLQGNSIYLNPANGLNKKQISDRNVNAWSESAHTVDVDNDHDLDLFFTTQFGTPNLLYLNDGSGHFSGAPPSELTQDPTNSPGACWCDFDLDGDMDVFVVNRDGEDDQLYVNDGHGIFKRAAPGPWTGNRGDGRACAWGDLDGDGWPDLYVVNFVVKEDGLVLGKHRNYLYVNTGGGKFREEAKGIFVEEENASYGVALVDFDYDKDLDIYVTNVSISDENAFYENLGNGLFKKRAESVISYEIHRPSKGQTWGDFNNDGLMDLYIANGTEGYPEIQNFLFLGTPDYAFRRVYNSLPAVDGHISAGTASGDFDNDGDLDLYVCNWGGEAEANDYYINGNKQNQWIKFRLKGVSSNSYGIGSWIFLTLSDGMIQTRYCSRETGYGSENSTEIHFGVPEGKTIQNIEVLWPSGTKQAGIGLQLNGMYEIIEGQQIKRIGL